MSAPTCPPSVLSEPVSIGKLGESRSTGVRAACCPRSRRDEGMNLCSTQPKPPRASSSACRRPSTKTEVRVARAHQRREVDALALALHARPDARRFQRHSAPRARRTSRRRVFFATFRFRRARLSTTRTVIRPCPPPASSGDGSSASTALMPTTMASATSRVSHASRAAPLRSVIHCALPAAAFAVERQCCPGVTNGFLCHPFEIGSAGSCRASSGEHADRHLDARRFEHRLALLPARADQ